MKIDYDIIRPTTLWASKKRGTIFVHIFVN